MELQEIYPTKGHIQRLYCDNCKNYLDLTFGHFHEDVSDVNINIEGLPLLSCAHCNKNYLPDNSRFTIVYTHEQAIKKDCKAVKVKRNKTNEKYTFTEIPFIYDSDDYKYIPGLERQHDKGFLTPVFFNKEVLLKYDSSPTYRISFASTTYGEIRQGDDFSISFGLNKNQKVIMWLGDIAKLPESEQYYLKSENIESDHSIGSEFYDGQIEAKFTEHSKKDILFHKRSNFLEVFFKYSGEKIAHLDDEVYGLAIALNAPLIDSEKERRYIADTLNKIYIESFDNNALGRILKNLGDDPKNLGSIKRLENIMRKFTNKEKLAKIMMPFYVLYDLRVAFSHLCSNPSSEEKIQNIETRLDLSMNSGLIEIYNTLIDTLGNSFNCLSKTIKKIT